jgi:hypothetical protein
MWNVVVSRQNLFSIITIIQLPEDESTSNYRKLVHGLWKDPSLTQWTVTDVIFVCLVVTNNC